MKILKTGLVVAATSLSMATFANPTANVSALTGNLDNADTRAYTLSVRAPLGANAGVQIDGLYADVADTDTHGGAIQLYTRSDKGLVSANYRYLEFDQATNDESVTIKGEYFITDRVTLKAQIHNDVGGNIKGEGYGIGATMYPNDNLAISSFISKIEIDDTTGQDSDRYGLAAELQTPVKGLAVFATLSEGDDDYDAATIGARYYIGESKSLKERHRTGDLENAFLDNTRAFSIY